LLHDIQGLIPVNPEGGKLARANAVSAQIESGNVYLPHPMYAPWVLDFLAEVASFPAGRYDDQVDAMTQALIRLRQTCTGLTVPVSELIVDPFTIPEEWRKASAMAATPNGVSALWGAMAPDKTIYLYWEHVNPDAEPSQNAEAILAAETWKVPCLLNGSCMKGTQEDKEAVAQIYRQLGLNIQICESNEAGIYGLKQLFASKKLKVFSSLTNFQDEYLVGGEESPLLLCVHTLIGSSNRMCAKPVPYREPPQRHYGERDWRA
jgi:hypothetical protein